MNEENLHSWMEPEFEARIIALILGEASDFEKEETERQIAESPEATLFFKRMANLHALLGTIPLRTEQEDKDWKLSQEKREKLIQTIGEPQKTEDPSIPIASPSKTSQRLPMKWKILIPVAASFGLLALVGTLALGTLPGIQMAGRDSYDLTYAQWEEGESSVERYRSMKPRDELMDSVVSDFETSVTDGRVRRESAEMAKAETAPMAPPVEGNIPQVAASKPSPARPPSLPEPTSAPQSAEPAEPALKLAQSYTRSGSAPVGGVDGGFAGAGSNSVAGPGQEKSLSNKKKQPASDRSRETHLSLMRSDDDEKRAAAPDDAAPDAAAPDAAFGFPVAEADKNGLWWKTQQSKDRLSRGELGRNKSNEGREAAPSNETMVSGYVTGTGGVADTSEVARLDDRADIPFSGGARVPPKPAGVPVDHLASVDPFFSDAGVTSGPEQDARESESRFKRESVSHDNPVGEDAISNGTITSRNGNMAADPFSSDFDKDTSVQFFEKSAPTSRLGAVGGEAVEPVRGIVNQVQSWNRSTQPEERKSKALGDQTKYDVKSGESRGGQVQLEFPTGSSTPAPDPDSLDISGNIGGGGGGGIDEGERLEVQTESAPMQKLSGLSDSLVRDQYSNRELERESLESLKRVDEVSKERDEELLEATGARVSGRKEDKDLVSESLRSEVEMLSKEMKDLKEEVAEELVEEELEEMLVEITPKFAELPEEIESGFTFDDLNEKSAEEEPFSTFSLHVGDSSFHLARAALSNSQWPERDSVRVEEFVNALDYRDPIPTHEEKVSVALDQARHPFIQQRNLLRISLATAARGRQASVPLRLTLLLDNSGSMERPDRYETVQRAFALLLAQLQENDEVTLISFARQPRLLADRVKGPQAAGLVDLVANLPSEGGTNLEAALDLAFQKAQEQQVPNAQNRIILLTDGAANLGDAEPTRLGAKIENFRDAGIAFDAAGIGAQGLNDEILEALTRKGDGRYYLLDRPEDADAGFARQIAGALRPAAGNVKVQVEFNPDRVGAYQLIGFEKHRLKKEDFRNDAVDAAELAAAEAGVAVYQVEAKPEGRGDIGFVSVRFRDLSSGEMVEKRWPILYDPNTPPFEQAAPAIRIAGAAAFLGSRLREDALGQTVDLGMLSNVLNDLPSVWKRDEGLGQLREMVQKTRALTSE